MKACQNCGKVISSTSRAAKFCSNACRTTAYRKRHGIAPPSFLDKRKRAFLTPDEEREVKRLQLEVTDYERVIGGWESMYSNQHIALLLYQTYGEKNDDGSYYFYDTKVDKERRGWIATRLKVEEKALPDYITLRTNIEEQREKISELEKELLIRQRRIFRILDGAKAREIVRKVEKTSFKGSDLVKMKFDTLAFEGEWRELIGEPSRSFYGLIWGDAKAGKSYFSLRLAQYLSQFGDVAYVATEEGFSQTMQKKVIDLNALDVQIIDTKELSEIVKQIADSKFVFIDSATKIDLTPDDVSFLRESHPDTAFIILLQAVKHGTNFKGDQRFKHDADFVIEVERESANTTRATCQGRFGNGTIESSY